MLLTVLASFSQHDKFCLKIFIIPTDVRICVHVHTYILIQ